MRLKSFQAKSMSEAMRQIRETLGDDAIIVTSKEEKSGWVRITAAVEHLSAPAEKPAKQQEGFSEDEITEIITDTLLKHRVPGSVSDKIAAAAMTQTGNDPKKILAKALQKTFTFEKQDSSRPIILVGPPGAGKTLMTAKLAARAVLDGLRPAVITTDIARAGGVEQLEAFLDIMALPLQQAEDAKTLKQEMTKSSSAAQIIVDTGGLNPFDPQEMKSLAKLLAVADMDPILVLPAGGDAEESAEIAMTFEVLGVRRFLPTRLDFARRLGGILSAADRGGLIFTEASHTPQVANGLVALTPEKLADLLMPHLPQKDKIKRGKK